MVIKRQLRSNSTSAPAPESQTVVAAVTAAAQPVAPLSPDDWQADDTAEDQMSKVERRGRPRKMSGHSGTESPGEDGGSSNSTKNGYDSGTNANSNGNSVASNSSASNVNTNITTKAAATANTTTSTSTATATITTNTSTTNTSTTTTTTSGSSNNGSASTPKAPQPKRIIRLKPPNPSKRRKTESTDAKRHATSSEISPSAERRSERPSARMPESNHGNGTRTSASTVKTEQIPQRAASEARANLTKWQPRRWGRRRVVLRTTSGEFAVPIWCSTEKRQAPPVSR